jgi:hypothetical protein
MKSDTQKKDVRLYHLVMAGFVMFLALIFAAQTWAGENCEKITIVATMHAVTPNPMGQYVGTAVLTVGDSSCHSDVVVNPQGMPKFSEDGTMHLEMRSQLFCPELASMLECYDQAVLVPDSADPSHFRINNRVSIIDGTGVFSEAYGRLIAHGEASMSEGIMSVVAEGRVCDLKQ